MCKDNTILPLSGAYSIPGDYNTIGDAAVALNTFGISGSVVFNVASSHTETAPSGVSALLPGGIIFGSISGTSSTNTIVFQKSGNGTNPLVIAGENHFAGGIMDAVVKFVGADYITFNGIDVSENPLNTNVVIASNNMTEFGYAFFKSSTTDGSKNNTIKNCTIRLNTGFTNYPNTIGIYSTTITTSVNGLTLSNNTSTLGSNSNNSILLNTIDGANMGIVVIGSNTAAAMDSGWMIDENIITDFGIGKGEATSLYQKLGTTVQGILINQSYDFIISNNTINSINGGLTVPISMVGIVMGWSGTTVQPTGTYTNVCQNNNVSINHNLNENMHGIWSRIGNATSNVTFLGNTISLLNSGTSLPVSKLAKGIYQQTAVGDLEISENQVQISYQNTDHSDVVHFIQADVQTAIKREINGNNLSTPSGQTLRTNGAVTGISHHSISSNELNINQNIISINKGNNNTASVFYGIYSASTSATVTYSISNNNILLENDFTTTGNTTVSAIFCNDGITASTNKTISNNIISIQTKNVQGTTHGILSGKANQVIISENEITISNYCNTINGIFLTTGSVNNQLDSNRIIISPINMPANTTNIRGINNSVGILNTNSNQITIAPSFESAASVFVNLFGVDNSVANSSISNNTRLTLSPVFNVGSVTGNIAVIRNTAVDVEIANNELIELNAVNNSGNLSAIGILNSGANSIIQNNEMVSLSVTAQTAGSVNGIESATAGAGSQIINNDNVIVTIISTTANATSNGILMVNGFVKNNTNINVNVASATTSSLNGINASGEIENNIIDLTANAQTGITGTAGILSRENTLVKDNQIITNLVTASGNAIAMGINSSNANSHIINNSIDHAVISNVNDSGASWRGEVFGIKSFGANTVIEDNKIIKVFGSMGIGTTYFEVAGVFLDRAENPIVLGNTISNVSCNGTARDRIYLSGIYVTGNSYNGLIKNNKIFNISYNNSVTGTIFVPPFFSIDIPANTNGIWIRIANNTTASDYTIVNNHISKLYHNNASKIGGIFGLALSTKELNYKVYHNTILIGDNDSMITSNTTSHFGGTAVGFVNRVGNGSLDLRNNILYVNLMPRSSGYVSALAAIKSHEIGDGTINPGQTTIRPVNYHMASNNNLFYAPSVHGRRSYFYCEGDGFGTEYNRFNIDHNLAAVTDPNININPNFTGCVSKYKTFMAGSDSNSFYQNVTLVEGTGDQEGVWTPVGETFTELGAQLIDAIHDLDFNNVSRGSAIDMGAVQFNGEAVVAPEIVYSPLTLTGCGLAPSSLVLENVQITDNSGTNTTGSFIPRLYYRMNSGAWISVAGTLVSGDSTNGFWNFTLTGLSAGTLSYYVIAQDKLSKVGAVPGSGLVACNVNSVTTHPTSPNTLTLGGATTTYALGSWSSTPDIGKAVVFDDNVVISSNIEACSVLVKSGRTVTVDTDVYLTVLNEVVVEAGANLIFNDKASLVQINNTTNSGNIEYNRIASIKKLDYVYWSSPVIGNGGVSGFNINNLSANPTEINGPKYKWNTLQNNNNGTGGNISQGIWVNANANLMESGKGYIVRAPNSFSEIMNQPYQASFNGVPFNGDLSYPINRGDYTGTDYVGLNGQTITNLDDNFNLIGNPYPSAISAARFLYRNAPANGGSIIGGVRIWTHGNSPSTLYQDPFYGSFTYNYTSTDYIIYSLLGSNCCPALEDDFMIAAGQGFFVQMQDGTAASDFVYFDNTMRSKNYTNANFYRTANPIENTDFTFEKHRIWLDVLNENLSSNRMLLGYAEGATLGLDDLFDVSTKEVATLQIYSFAEETKTITQARPLPFDTNDEVSIGVNIPTQGEYTIALAGIDGLFDYTPIYLKDTSLNVVHDLKESPYHFQAEKGMINNRFQIVYQNANLSQPDFNTGSVITYVKNNEIHIKSSLDEINEITLFDLTGRKIYQKKIITKETILSDLNIANQTILIQLKMSDNQLITKKIIF